MKLKLQQSSALLQLNETFKCSKVYSNDQWLNKKISHHSKNTRDNIVGRIFLRKNSEKSFLALLQTDIPNLIVMNSRRSDILRQWMRCRVTDMLRSFPHNSMIMRKVLENSCDDVGDECCEFSQTPSIFHIAIESFTSLSHAFLTTEHWKLRDTQK
ncbi:CLUMA_CG004999, isoform A [Clunio marinus]|uniref:CLUMA_CG004999, isoform A n=1 Tax=Clunio marinus TaxID=568069 RepID=A0A1J1HTK0_9DIPT|nr:CLUMA_CG004999, isoform A [Clunio marinus]